MDTNTKREILNYIEECSSKVNSNDNIIQILTNFTEILSVNSFIIKNIKHLILFYLGKN